MANRRVDDGSRFGSDGRSGGLCRTSAWPGCVGRTRSDRVLRRQVLSLDHVIFGGEDLRQGLIRCDAMAERTEEGTVKVRRRTGAKRCFGLAVAAVLGLVLASSAKSEAFSLDDVAKKAETLAKKDFEDRSRSIPKWLLDMNYDQWRDIRFKTEQSLWRSKGLPFELQFFHLGLYYDRAIKLNEIVGSKVDPVGFSPNQFDYGKNDFGSRIPQDLGYAGFRVHYPINKPQYKDEVIVFVGASYFRAVAKDTVYGQSARGLAVDTALPTGEEFPYFREFWLVRPTKESKSLVIYALLDSQRVTGAYKYTVTPGTSTKV
ncbi:MAG: hypothetical protein E4H00_07900, partial [Myxococcales bacterium]